MLERNRLRHFENINSLTLVLTSGCNLACSYCYQNAKSGRRIRWETVRLATQVLLASHRDRVELVFYGGEPLIQFDLIRRAVDSVESLKRTDQLVDYAVITNGTPLHRLFST